MNDYSLYLIEGFVFVGPFVAIIYFHNRFLAKNLKCPKCGQLLDANWLGQACCNGLDTSTSPCPNCSHDISYGYPRGPYYGFGKTILLVILGYLVVGLTAGLLDLSNNASTFMESVVLATIITYSAPKKKILG